VYLFHGGMVKKGEFENIKEEVELFHRLPRFSELI
jgi:hypothetical protein